MTCREFERWLDAGMPASDAAAAAGHAGTCVRCAALLASARAIEALLSAPAPVAPVGFADRVMERVANAAAARIPRVAPPLPRLEAFPWWVRAAANPAAALALLLAGVLMWRAGLLWSLGRSFALRVADGAMHGLVPVTSVVMTHAFEPLSREGQIGLFAGLLALALVGAVPLFRWTEHAVRMHPHRGRAGLSGSPRDAR